MGLTPYNPACCSRDSLGEKKGSIVNSCGTTPRHDLAAFGFLSMLLFQTIASPDVLMVKPAKILIKVDLPAPLGPRSPNIDPLGISNEIESNAKKSPFPSGFLNFLERLLMLIAFFGRLLADILF